MDALSRHVTLCNEKYFLSGIFMKSSINYDNSMAGESPLDEDVSCLYTLNISYRNHFLRKGPCSCVPKGHGQVLFEVLIRIVGSPLQDKTNPTAADPGPVAPGPLLIDKGVAGSKVELYSVFFSVVKKVFPAETHYRIGALLEIVFSHIDIDYGMMERLVWLQTSVEVSNGGPRCFQWEVPEKGLKTSPPDLCSCKILRRSDVGNAAGVRMEFCCMS